MRAPIALAVLALAACGGDDGATVEPADLGIQAFAVADSLNVELDVTFTTRSSPDEITFAAIDEGDELVAALGGDEIVLREQAGFVGGPVRYLGSFADVGDRALIIELRRGGVSLATSTVTVPSPFFVIDAPTEHARGNDMMLEWDASGEVGTTRVLLDGPCVVGSEVRIDADPGNATIPAAAFDDPSGGSCRVLVQVDRLADGQASEAFGRGGRVEAVQTRSFNVDVSD